MSEYISPTPKPDVPADRFDDWEDSDFDTFEQLAERALSGDPDAQRILDEVSAIEDEY
jgi:hypothetical protein